MKKLLLAITFIIGVAFSNTASAQETIKIGVLAPLEGAYTVLGEDALRGVKTALNKVDNKAGGKTIELLVRSTNTTPKSAIEAAQELIDEKVDIIIGPTSSEQGIAIRDFSKSKTQTTFINGVSGAVQATYISSSENFFRFNSDNAQWSVGLGDYVYNQKEYEKVAIVANDYTFNHAQVFGFTNEYCAVGGEVAGRHWLPLGATDFSQTISEMDTDIDAVYLGLSGTDAIQFIRQYKEAGGKAKLIGSSITLDGALLNASDDIKQMLIGMPSSGPQADTWGDENWQAFLKDYKNSFPPDQRFISPSILATSYYNAASAALVCLNQVSGDLSQNQAKLRQCLSTIELAAPNGVIKLDKNRQAIANNFVTEVIEQEDGSLVKKLVTIRENVNQTLGLSKKAYDAMGLPSRDGISCRVQINQ